MDFVRRHRFAVFVVITFAVTWTAWISIALSGRVVGVGFDPLYMLGLIGPLIGAFVTTALVDGGPGVLALLGRCFRVRAGARAWTLALGLPLLVAVVMGGGALLAATFGVGFHVPRDFGAFNGFPHTSPLVLWVLLVVVNGLGEETGWRGFLASRLAHRGHPPLTVSLIVAAVWAAWHVPAFAITETYRLMPIAMLPMFFLGLLAGSVFLTWLYDKGRHSILVVAAWHGTFNLLSGTLGARGGLAALESAAVMIAAVAIVVHEVRVGRKELRAAA